MKILNKVPSKVDKTIKFILQLKDGLIIELSYINTNDGRDIICAPSQTSCNLGCKFCHITNISKKLVHRNLTSNEIVKAVGIVGTDLNLGYTSANKLYKKLYISFMGVGEPLLNLDNVLPSMDLLEDMYFNIEFAIATSMPMATNYSDLNKMIEFIKIMRSDVKLHLSLHYTNQGQRMKWMPAASNIGESMFLLNKYQQATGNKAEVHYTLINKVNDSNKAISDLIQLISFTDISVKFLYYNENPEIPTSPSKPSRIKEIINKVKAAGIDCKYYTPPGLDVGASCGQFFEESYLKYNSKEVKKNG